MTATATPYAGTREEWLEAVTEALRPDFAALAKPLPRVVRMSCGWASAGVRSNVIGECWTPDASDASVCEIFISPTIADSVEAGHVLAHELTHAACGHAEGHGSEFRRVATGLGMVGRMTATRPGEALVQRLSGIIAEIGAYPHAELSLAVWLRKHGKASETPATAPGDAPKAIPSPVPGWRRSGPRVQSTRMLKVVCLPDDGGCGCTIRMTRKWLNDVGAPTCACGVAMSAVDA